MTDRVPTPGKEGRVKLTFDDGAIQYAKVEMADEPTQDGTPLNKATLLSDSTAALYEFGAEEEPTVDAALRQLPYRVGDTLTTARTNLGNNWRLCNGAELTRSSYPDLSDLMPADISRTSWKNGSAPPLTSLIKMVYANGYWVALGNYLNGSTYYARLCYKTSITGSWTAKDLWSGERENNAHNVLNDLIYRNGYFIVIGQYSYKASGSQGYTNVARLAYSTTINGTYKFKTIWSTANYGYYSQDPVSITYGNGYYVVCGNRGNYGQSYVEPVVAYSTSLSGTWTVKAIVSVTANQYSCNALFVTYTNEYFVVCGESPSSDSGATHGAAIYYAKSPSSTWTKKDLYTGKNPSQIDCIVYASGYWVASGVTSSGDVVIYYGSNITGALTKRVIESSMETDNLRSYIIYDGKDFVVLAANKYELSIWYRTTPTGAFTRKPVLSNSSSNNAFAQCIVFANNLYVVDGAATSAGFMYADITKINLPSISLSDDVYTYMKVLE